MHFYASVYLWCVELSCQEMLDQEPFISARMDFCIVGRLASLGQASAAKFVGRAAARSGATPVLARLDRIQIHSHSTRSAAWRSAATDLHPTRHPHALRHIPPRLIRVCAARSTGQANTSLFTKESENTGRTSRQPSPE